ncbi:MAG TPA: hypothetical protein PLM53_11270 [Spirochaetota bacterium]|nr:hypothetical protein [Spirochaetota bacterium]HPC41528.1 hypothetical protein [Spirochaetota bacterium]HPL15584.1 hypothetical protein [Spirochaetota bacterium]HQF09103.1 hypothetical protein [Spirochaetota bacterium]HQH97672.1 hypothetical protein [Spirochaetota bacterium]
MNNYASCTGARALCLACTVVSSDGKGPADITRDAGILGETTVATVDGYGVGSGNYYRRADAGGVRRRSMQIFVWRPGSGSDMKAKEAVVFEGDIFEVGGKKYRLIHVDEGTGGDTGKAFFVPVQ